MRRFLNVHTLDFREFHEPNIPSYVILSHRWASVGEAKFMDVLSHQNQHLSGYRKIEGFASYVKRNMPTTEWIWLDTCCINQDSTVELTEAITSMFRWYSEADICLAYLMDVSDPTDMQAFASSSWFRRGWTLQELLAPRQIIFLSRDWQLIGYKTGVQLDTANLPLGPSLDTDVSAITGIPREVLLDFSQCSQVAYEDIFDWMRERRTTRVEDHIYCLLSIFNIRMAIFYGEGEESARQRLYRKLQKSILQQTLSPSDLPRDLPRPALANGEFASSDYRSLRGAVSTSAGQSSNIAQEDEHDQLGKPAAGEVLDSALAKPVGSPSEVAESPHHRPQDEARAGTTQSLPYIILEEPTDGDDRHRYFLDGTGLARYVLMRQLVNLAGSNAEACQVSTATHNGFIIVGQLPEKAAIDTLREQSQEHERERKATRDFIA